MKVKSLVKVISHYDGGFHLTFFRPTFSIFYAAMNHKHSLEVAKRFISEQLAMVGKAWIQSHSKKNNWINCPEGCIKLPEDTWYCKLSNDICKLQACIKLDHTDDFFENCNATEEKKTQILKTVKLGNYDGFHHVTARQLCVSCADKKEIKEYFKYHYPWEFAEIDVAICGSYNDVMIELYKTDIPQRYIRSPLCAQCCYDLAIKLRPELKDSLYVIESNFHYRS
ncbi:hypothetical protein ACMYQ1_08950 [Shewanella oncorhynchi]|uniref:hypothetical protein n=1 Tax=Shewanella oncorhynchi TaxID=2726434 RepID=UPI0039EE167C